MTEMLWSTFDKTVMITVFVLIMMIAIEYINVQSRNLWAEKIRNSPFLQIIMASLLGLIPGCMGAFTVVSLYTHRMIGFAALVSAMIATSGDEAFVMFAMFPGKAMILHGALLAVAVMAGWVVHALQKNGPPGKAHGYIIHEQEYCRCFDTAIILPQLRRISFERALLMLAALVFVILLLTGLTGGDGWNWKKITFLAGALFLLFVFVSVPDHFLKEHLYNHILKKHLLRLFLWTWFAFIVLHFIDQHLMVNDLVRNNAWLVLVAALMIGMVPESGPHLLFATLFADGLIPFSILIASSIVQDGHGMLPLLAESRKDFIRVKLINMLAGALVGGSLMLAGI